jgi:hypothetical protein
MRNPNWPGRMLLDGTGKRVFAHCGKRTCHRRLAELRGVHSVKLVRFDEKRVGYRAARDHHWFTCQCGAKPQRRRTTLNAEFAAAAPKARIYLA